MRIDFLIFLKSVESCYCIAYNKILLIARVAIRNYKQVSMVDQTFQKTPTLRREIDYRRTETIHFVVQQIWLCVVRRRLEGKQSNTLFDP